MITIASALYHEARPLIDWYDLKKNHEFQKVDVFENESLRVIITGTGKIQSAIAITHVLSQSACGEKIINLGICGAVEEDIKTGSLFLVHEIRDFSSKKRYYPDILTDFQIPGIAVTTFDTPITQDQISQVSDKLEIVDMEASGFYESAIRYYSPDRIQVLKIVSDHLEGTRCTPDLVSDIFLQNKIQIQKIISHSPEKKEIINAEELLLLQQIAQTLKFTRTQWHMFLDFCKAYKIRTSNDFSILQKYLEMEVNNKTQNKGHFETIRSLLFA